MSGGQGCGGGGVGNGAEDGTGMKKGPWTAAEDAMLMEYVKEHGEGNWNAVQKYSGLSRCGKSCRLRWANHLRPNLKKGAFSPDEECLILQLHSKLGNKWARMAAQLPGRTDNEIKNYWNTRIKRRKRQGLPLYPPEIQLQAAMHAALRPPAPSPSLHLLDHSAAPVPPPPMGFYAQSFVQDAGYNGGHHQVHHFLPSGVIHRLTAGGFSLPFPSHGQIHPFFHQGQGPLPFGGAGMANLNPPPDAGVSIKSELPSSQNPDPGSSALIYEMPATDLDAFVLHSGDHAAAPVPPPPPMGFYAQSFVQDAGYNGGHHQVQHFLPSGAIHRLKAGGFSLPFPSHGQIHPFFDQGQGPLPFGGAGMANLNPSPDAGVSIKSELPSSQNPDPGSSAPIYEMPATDLDAFVLHSGDHAAAPVPPPPPMDFNAQSFVQDAGYNDGHHQVRHFLPSGAIHRLKAGRFSLPFPSHGQMHPFFHQGQGPLPFGGAGMANLDPPPDAGVSIKSELPSSQNPDPGSSAVIYEMPATDLDAFVLHSGDGGRDGYLLDPRRGQASLVGHPPPMSLNASSSNAVHWTGSGGGVSNSDHPLPPDELG